MKVKHKRTLVLGGSVFVGRHLVEELLGRGHEVTVLNRGLTPIEHPASVRRLTCDRKAGCHASRFKPDAHKKVDSPKLLYTVAELKDCSGSCHTYTNSTFTTILRSRSGEHRSTSGGF